MAPAAFRSGRRAFIMSAAEVCRAAIFVPTRPIWPLAGLENEWSGAVLLATRNIDDLHERAGSRNLIHMYGELLKASCRECGAALAG